MTEKIPEREQRQETTCRLMGILNITPDSFSDGGKYVDESQAIVQARRLSEDGAQIIDIGGESTAPGSKAITGELEQKRILRIVEQLASEFVLSIDTYRSSTARAALERGARMINDVSALRADPDMPKVLAEYRSFVVLMHSKEADDRPHASESSRDFKDVISEVADFLSRRIDFALSHGIPEDRIIVDPGMGKFLSHDPKYSWELLSRFQELVEKLSPLPVLVATSRKGFLGGTLSERDDVSQLTALFAAEKGARIIRTHNPRQAAKFLACWKNLTISKDQGHL